jgi:spore germination protein GerM
MEGPPPRPTTQTADLTIHPKGSEMVLAKQENLTVLPFDDPGTTQIQVYWTSAETVQPLTQVIPKTQAVGRAAIEELLWGPGPRAMAFPGFNTALPTPEQIAKYPGKQSDWGPRVTLRSLNIANGVATADFSKEINAYGGGSTRVSLMAKQITSTLRQFATIHEVRIAVEGETEAVLQP